MALPHKTKIPVGSVLAGKYKVTREIGRGGMAAVYEAENIDIGKRIAIKVLAQELTSSAIVVERFLREARAAAAIRSPYICDVYDSGRLDEGAPFLVLELLEGESLYEKMTKVRYLDVDTTVTVLTQVCRGLTKAHAANIVHRDLKPENIFLTKDEEGKLLAKILDFGLAKFYAPLEGGDPKQARLTREGAVFGTPAYMSPEQVRGQGAVDHRADLWALGCIAYECLTGKTVWSTDQGVAMTFAQIANAPLPKPNTLRPDLAPAFTEWFEKALNRNIDQRFQSAKEFAAGLANAFHQPAPSYSSIRFGVGGDIDVSDTSEDPPVSRPTSSAQGIAAPPSPQITKPEPTPPQSPQPSPDPTSARGSKLGFVAPPQPSAPADVPELPPNRSGFGRGVVVIGALALAAGAAYFGWQQFGGEGTGPVATSSATAPASSPSAPRTGTPVDSALALPANVPWLAQVRDAEQAIASDDLKTAARLLKEAFDKGGSGVPKTMGEHVAVAMADTKQRCKLAGLGRPRTFDLANPSARPAGAGRPSIALGPKGPVMTWSDAHEGAEHVYTALLDTALRNLAEPVDVTPEAAAVGRPEIARAGDKLVLTYWDAKGNNAGVKVRLLDGDGRIASPAVAVGPNKGGNFWPSLTAAPDGSFYVAWTDEDGDSEDLYLRHLKPSLEIGGDIVRATDLVPNGPTKPRARFPSIAFEAGALQLGFRVEKDPQHLIERMRLSLDQASKGIEPLKPGKPRVDRMIGDVAIANGDKSKADGPDIACGKGACYLVWHGEGPGGGAWIAYVDPSKAQPLWFKKFAKLGAHPSVAVAPTGEAEVVWFEAGKILTAPVGRDSVDVPSKLARVSGDQPTPAIAPGEKPGEWYVAWLDYEIGHLEAYGARFLCK